MSIGFFIVGALIFSIYIGLTLWGITYANKKQSETNNYKNLDNHRNDVLDTDGTGNFSRFQNTDKKK